MYYRKVGSPKTVGAIAYNGRFAKTIGAAAYNRRLAIFSDSSQTRCSQFISTQSETHVEVKRKTKMVTLIVATTTDPASINPANALLAMPGWQSGPPIKVSKKPPCNFVKSLNLCDNFVNLSLIIGYEEFC